LYKCYLVKFKADKSKLGKISDSKQLNSNDGQEGRAKQRRNKLVKYAVFAIIAMLSATALYKHRLKLINLLKLIFNMKVN
jgi:polyferredoxin